MAWKVKAMGLGAVSQIFGNIGSALSGAGGAGTVLFLAGFAILLAMAIAILVLGLVKLIKALPSMTVSGFLKLMLVTAVVLMVLGLVVPG